MHALRAAGLDHGVAGQERCQMFGDADRTHARSAAAMRNRKSLVQVQMADIRTDVSRAGQADLRVHVGTIHVNLAAIGVDDAGDFVDAFFIDTVGARVGDHQTGKVVLVLLGFLAQVGHVDIAVLVAFHQHDLQAAHRGAGRIGAMRRGRDQRDVAAGIAARLMVGLYHQQAGIFTLRAAVRLEAHLRETCDFAERLVQTGNNFLVTGRLF
jgi:hypothetical protein